MRRCGTRFATGNSVGRSNLADKWNTDNDGPQAFPGLIVGPATGFLADCPKLHFLYNNGVNLPMAWDDCSMVYSSNFDLDYDEDFGSNFRASQGGWVSARFQTYCGDEAPSKAAPTMSTPMLAVLALLLSFLGMRAVNRPD